MYTNDHVLQHPQRRAVSPKRRGRVPKIHHERLPLGLLQELALHVAHLLHLRPQLLILPPQANVLGKHTSSLSKLRL